jgi:hypothetical protein
MRPRSQRGAPCGAWCTQATAVGGRGGRRPRPGRSRASGRSGRGSRDRPRPVRWTATWAGARGFYPGAIRGRVGVKPPNREGRGPSLAVDFSMPAWQSNATEAAEGGAMRGHGAPRRRPMEAREVAGRDRVAPGPADVRVEARRTGRSKSVGPRLGVPSPVQGPAEAGPIHGDERTVGDGGFRRSGTRCHGPKIPDQCPAETGRRNGVAMPGCG